MEYEIARVDIDQEDASERELEREPRWCWLVIILDNVNVDGNRCWTFQDRRDAIHHARKMADEEARVHGGAVVEVAGIAYKIHHLVSACAVTEQELDEIRAHIDESLFDKREEM